MTSYFCWFFCKQRTERGNEFTPRSLAAASRWIVIWMTAVWSFTFIRLPNALTNFGVGGFGPNRVKPLGFSSLVLGAGALALISFLQGEQHTHTHTAKWGLSKAIWTFHPPENWTHYNQCFAECLFTICLFLFIIENKVASLVKFVSVSGLYSVVKFCLPQSYWPWPSQTSGSPVMVNHYL